MAFVKKKKETTFPRSAMSGHETLITLSLRNVRVLRLSRPVELRTKEEQKKHNIDEMWSTTISMNVVLNASAKS